jgi:hypothetical protein
MVKVKTSDFKNAVEQSLISSDYSKVSLITDGNTLKIGSFNYESFYEKYANGDYSNVYENYLSISIDVAEKSSDIKTLVFRDDLLNLLNAIKSEYVRLFIQKDKTKYFEYAYYLIINDGKKDYRLPTQEPDLVESFVDKRLVQKDIESGVKIKTKVLIDAIDKVIYATHNGNYFLIQKTIGLIFKDNKLFLAGTSENHTAIYDLKVKSSYKSKKHGIVKLNGRGGITKTAALTIKKVFSSSEYILLDIVNGGEYKIAIFKSGNIMLTTKIIKEDVYPNVFETINSLNDKHTIQAKLPKNAIIDILKHIILVETERSKQYANQKTLYHILQKEKLCVMLLFSNNNLNIKGSVFDKGVNVNIEYIGNAIEDEYVVDLDAIDLIKTLSNMHTDEIIMTFSPEEKLPSYIGSTDGRYSVMVKLHYVKKAKNFMEAV